MNETRVILGPPAELEEALADAVRDARAADPLAPVTVLTGNTLLKRYLPRTLAARGLAQLNVRYLRPHELARQMAAQARPDHARPAMARAVEQFLVREIARGAGGYFAAVAQREGFAGALLRLFREVEQGGYSAVALARALGPADETGKFGQLALLYGAYRRRREQLRFSGAADDAEAALAAPLEGPLFVYGLLAPPLIYERLIVHCAAHTPVTVFLPCSGTAPDEAHAGFRAALAAAGAVDEQRGAPAAGVARALFREPNEAVEDARVRLISAPDTVREVWEAARACLDWARDGIRFHEMAVVYRNQDPYRALIDEIFREAKIETYLHDGRPLAQEPRGRRVLALLELARDHARFGRAAVMEFLAETELARETARAYERVRPAEWESYTREAGVVEGISQWRDRLARLAREKREESRTENYEWLADVAGRIETLARFIDDFHAALAERPEEATWREHLAFLRRLAERYAAGCGPVLDALEDLRQLEAVRERVPFDEFLRAVRDDLESRDVSGVFGEPVREFGKRGVAVIDATSLQQLHFRAISLVGLSERAWPPPPRPDPLLLEHERRRVNEAASGRLPLRTEPDREALGFWLAVQSATEHLRISYARADAGRTAKHVPSYFFREVADALEGRRLRIDDLDASAFVQRFAAGRLACDERERSLSDAEYDRGLVRASNEGDSAAGIVAIERAAPAFARARVARRRRWSHELTEYDGVMISAAALAAARERSPLARGEPVSPSRLETWATCPQRHFLRYTLGIDPVDEPEKLDRIDHLQRGSLIHEILQTFLTRLGRGDPPGPRRRAAHLPVLHDVAQAAFRRREEMGVTGRPLIWAIDRREISEDLVRWYDAEARDLETAGVLPGAFEARFGPSRHGLGEEDRRVSRDEPLGLRADGRDLLLQGRIDRIDWDDARTRFRVIDYKTGKKYPRLSDMFQRGEALQLPVYLHAAADMLGIDPANGEAQYFYVSRRGEFGRHPLTGVQLGGQRESFAQILATAADGIDNGFFALNPAHDHCRWCDYRDVCDARRERLMQGKRGDPRGAAYRALEELP